jgi:hypothetical protein
MSALKVEGLLAAVRAELLMLVECPHAMQVQVCTGQISHKAVVKGSAVNGIRVVYNMADSKLSTLPSQWFLAPAKTIKNSTRINHCPT